MESILFRFANKDDVPLILHFIKELAAYEKMLDDVTATEGLLREWVFEKHKAEVIFALEGGKEIGFALFFHNFSTFLGKSSLREMPAGRSPTSTSIVCWWSTTPSRTNWSRRRRN